MSYDDKTELYQQVILEHNKKPRNYHRLENHTHHAEGYNPLCGDHLDVFLKINDNQEIEEVTFTGDGCAISKASASMMTSALKGVKVEQAREIFEDFHSLVQGKLDPEKDEHKLGKLAVFSGIWHFPARVKCASLSWHTMNGALDNKQTISTE